jgi:hypothetical protein
MARQAGFGEFDDVLVAIGERSVDQRVRILVARRDLRGEAGAAEASV